MLSRFLKNYKLKDTQDIQDALKQVFGPIFEAVLKGECKITSVMKRIGIQKIQQMPVMGISRRRWKPRWAKFLFVSPGTVRTSLNCRL